MDKDTAKNKLFNKLIFYSTRIRINVSTKIFVGFSINIVLMFIIMWLTINNVGKFYSLANNIANKNYKSIRSAKIIARLLVKMSKKDEQILYAEPSSLEKNSPLRKVFEIYKAGIKNHLKILTSILKSSTEKKALADIKQKFPFFCNRFYFKIYLLKSGKKQETIKLFEPQLMLIEDMQKAAKLIINENDKKNEENLLELGSIEKNTISLQYFLSFFTLFFLIIFGCFLYFSIIEPITKLKEGAKSIAMGNLGEQIKIRSGDDFENLAKVFNEMSAKIQKLDEMKSDFISVVTHELRTPLTSIKESISIIKDEIVGPVNKKQARFLEITQEGMERLFILIKNLLDLVRMEGGMYSLSKKPVDISKLISENLLHLDALIQDKKINVITHIPDKQPQVNLDGIMFSRILTNLIGNAIKYSPKHGKLNIDVVFGSEKIISDSLFGKIKPHTPIVEIFIKDSGYGIEINDLMNIFSKFYQVKNSKTANLYGSGLGLSIAKEIVLAHNGRIGVKTKVGDGTCFFFALPIDGKGLDMSSKLT